MPCMRARCPPRGGAPGSADERRLRADERRAGRARRDLELPPAAAEGGVGRLAAGRAEPQPARVLRVEQREAEAVLAAALDERHFLALERDPEVLRPRAGQAAPGRRETEVAAVCVVDRAERLAHA